MSTNAPSIIDVAHHDAARFAPRIDLKTISEAEARKLMSEEHHALGYRPQPGSLAATVQSEAAKHPDTMMNVGPARKLLCKLKTGRESRLSAHLPPIPQGS